MKTFNELQRNNQRNFGDYKQVKVAILGDSATQLLSQMVRAQGFENQLHIRLYEADYDQIDFQILNSKSELYEFNPEYIILFLGVDKFKKSFYKCTEISERKKFAVTQIELLRNYLHCLDTLSSKIIILNLQERDDSTFGNYANNIQSSLLYQIRKYNLELMDMACESSNVFINDLCAMTSRVGHSFARDPKMYVTADITISIKFLPAVAQSLVGTISASEGRIAKCIILDLDNTLWGGVIGDDGIEKIQIGNLGIGKAFSEFQLWLKELKMRGIILAICSKNNEENAKLPFEKHKEMVLRLDDIAVFVANWNNKADNIRRIQEVLNIGFDSMVFLDDNPAEREIVRQNIPDVIIPNLPSDPAKYLDYLESLNLFETTSFSINDSNRTNQYQVESRRINSKSNFTDEGAFLKSLEMCCEVSSFNKFNIPRVTQLIQRSNQFNLRTIRYSEKAIEEIATSEEYLPLTFSLNDKFGDNGLVSVVVLKKGIDHLFVDSWVMSCRVLKRGLEEFILNYILGEAISMGYDRIIGQYLPTNKNSLVADLYKKLNFADSQGKWILNVSEAQKYNCFIDIVEKNE
ncbi:MAG: HAD family hydrolase [Cyclobacteriaceae bacterium]